MHADGPAQAGIALESMLEPDEIAMRADERKLRQVVFNLLSNAVKFTPPGGRVDVSAAPHDGVVEVAVADTGLGIAPHDQELIFEEFRQARDRSARATGGNGPRAAALPEVRRTAGRTALGRERPGRRQHLPLHAPS